jgi:hypothetical protein
MPLDIAPICTDKWVGKSMGGRSKITTNTDTCACMHILNQWELHNVHPQQKTALKTSMLSLKPKSILHNSVVGLACIHVPKLQHAILESVYIQKANVWIPMRGKRTKQERYLEGAEKQRGSPSKEVRTGPLLHVSVPSKPGLLCPQPRCCHYAQVIWPI